MDVGSTDAGGTARIALRGVRKVFGDVVAVDDVDLDVEDGELFAMLGPSGSGKTTVLRIIAGFEEPTSGIVRLGGVDTTGVPPFRRDVNTVFQDYALFPHMSVQQNVEYGLRVRGVAPAERRRRAGEALEMVRLEGAGSRKPHQLSGGQRQRVALARALVGRPKVLLLDEPLGALDLKLREQMQVELKAIQREVGITFVFVTHDQDEALTLADRLAVFNAGRIEQQGPAREVYERPANRFVAGFVGTANLLDDEVAEAIVGRPGSYAIRPEQIAIVASDGPTSARSVPVTVTEVIFAGPVTRVFATGPRGARLVATRLNASGRVPDRGEVVAFAWHEDAVHSLAPSTTLTKET